MKKIFLIIVLFMPLISLCQKKSNFLIFDGLMIKNKPNLRSKGFSRINVIYEDSLLSYPSNSKKVLEKKELNLNKYKRSASKVNSNKSPICIDIEAWPLYKENLSTNIQKYESAINLFRQLSQRNDIGYFGVLPYGNVYKYDSNFDKIAEQSTIAYPVFYTKNKNKSDWLKDVDKQLSIIKTNWPNLKIYAFIWPQYHTNNSFYKDKYIPKEFWEFQLEELRKRCDGVVIWMPPFELSNRKDIFWNDNYDWYKSTLSFITKYNIKSI